MGNKGGSYRRCYPHKLTPAIALDDSFEDIHTETIYIAQDDITPRADANSVYCFYIPELPEELSQHGVILTIFPNERIASWDLENRLLRCLQGLGASMYLDQAGEKGKFLFVGIDSCLHAQCFFDLDLKLYNNKYVAWGSEKRTYNIIEENLVQALKIRNQLEIRLEHERQQHRGSDRTQWINPSGSSSESFSLRALTRVEKTEHGLNSFNKAKIKQRDTRDGYWVYRKFPNKAGVAIEERTVKGQKMFAVQFKRL